MPKKAHRIKITADLRLRADEYKWATRSEVTELMREIVTQYAAGLPIEAPGYAAQTSEIKFVIDENTWERGLDRARSENRSFSNVLRTELERRLALAERQAKDPTPF